MQWDNIMQVISKSWGMKSSWRQMNGRDNTRKEASGRANPNIWRPRHDWLWEEMNAGIQFITCWLGGLNSRLPYWGARQQPSVECQIQFDYLGFSGVEWTTLILLVERGADDGVLHVRLFERSQAWSQRLISSVQLDEPLAIVLNDWLIIEQSGTHWSSSSFLERPESPVFVWILRPIVAWSWSSMTLEPSGPVCKCLISNDQACMTGFMNKSLYLCFMPIFFIPHIMI